MAIPPHTTPTGADRRAARARRARAWAWPVRGALVLCAGLAIWQEPQLSPWAHARMQTAVAYAGAALARATQTGQRLAGAARVSSGKGEGVSGWIVKALQP